MPQNNENTEVLIASYSLLNAVGGNTKQVVTSVRAGISAYAQKEDENTDQVLTAAIFPEELLPVVSEDMEEDLGLEEHLWQLLKLGKACISEFVQELPENMPPIPLLVLVPDWNKNVSLEDYEGFAECLVDYAGVGQKFSKVKAFCGGRSAGLQAMAYAHGVIESNRMELVAIGSIDTFVNEEYLDDMHDRLLGEEVMDGFVPGEGAAFMLLASKTGAEKYSLDQFASIKSIATASENGHLNSEETYTGDGLSEAITLVFEDESRQVSNVFCSMNGERIWAKEWGVSLVRNSDNFSENAELSHPAEFYGDIGVATGLTLSALAVDAVQRRESCDPVLIWCSDDFAPRYAMLIERAGKQ